MEKRLIIIDADNLLHRAYFATPLVFSKDRIPNNALRSFASAILGLKKEYSPTHIICAFDGGSPPHRKLLCPGYKSTRNPKPPELSQQLELARSVVAPAIGSQVLFANDTEADDWIDSAAAAADSYADILIATSDKDIDQTLRFPNVTILRPGKGTKWETWTREQSIAKWGVPPELIPSILALSGDSSDNIPGVKGVGPKTARRWLRSCVDLEGVITNAWRLHPPMLAANIIPETIRGFLKVTSAMPLDVSFSPTPIPITAPDQLRSLGLTLAAGEVEELL